jgi:nitronate monooxygenase
MAGVSTTEMAATVTNAGGVGSIGVGSVDAEATRQMVAAVRARTRRPFQVNVFCHKPAVVYAARKASWLARLEPDFARIGAKPPAHLAGKALHAAAEARYPQPNWSLASAARWKKPYLTG